MEMEAKRINVLDHGYVELLDVMGNDQAIVDAARVSVSGQGVKTTSDNRALIRYLMRMQHATPFEMVELKFRQKLPIFVARQQVRHRTAAINEMSARYSELPEEFYVPEPDKIAFQDKKNKQGRAATLPTDLAGMVQMSMRDDARDAFDRYADYLGRGEGTWNLAPQRAEIAKGGGVARELARINLPLSTYTEWVWKIDLRNLFGFLKLRLDAHAQYEIRVYAEAMAELIKPIVPLAWEAFEDYQLHATTFSRQELKILGRFILWVNMDSPSAAEALATESAEDGKPLVWPTKREGREFAAKLHKLMEMR